jgi:hypothetical protein
MNSFAFQPRVEMSQPTAPDLEPPMVPAPPITEPPQIPDFPPLKDPPNVIPKPDFPPTITDPIPPTITDPIPPQVPPLQPLT